MDATEIVDVALVEPREKKTVKKKKRKRKVKESLSAAENLKTDGEKLAGRRNGGGSEETTGTKIGDAVQEGKQVLKSCHVGVDYNIASGDKGIDLDATGDVAASCNVDEEKKGSKEREGSKKGKDVSAAAISENILGSEAENMACQTQNKGMEQITGNNVVKGTEMHIQNGAQDAVLLKSSPLSGDDNTIFKNTIDQDVIKNDVTEGIQEEKEDNKTPKKPKRETLSLAVNPEKNMATKGENLAIKNEISELGLNTVNQDVEETEVCHGAQDGGLRPKSSPVGVDHNILLEDNYFGQNTTVQKKENGKKMPKKRKKKKALSVAINSEPNLQKEGGKLASQTHTTGLEHIIGNQTLERTEMGDGSQECCLLPQELVVTDSHPQCITFNQDTQSLQNPTAAHLRDNICKQETMLDMKKNDVCADHCVTASEVAVLDAENPDTCKKKRKKRKRKLSSVSQSERNNEVGEKDGNVESSYVNDGESNNTGEPKNANSVPLAASISENVVLDVETPNSCKKKWQKGNRKVSSVSQSNLTNEDGEKDRNIESSSVNDGESKHSREGLNVAPSEGIPSTSSISHSDSIKDVCGRVYNSEFNHDKILLPPPEGQCGRPPSRKLLILDINGLLADIVSPVPFGYKPDLMLSRKAVFRRPFCESFLEFCFEKFDVGVWSSRVKINVDNVLNFLMGEMKSNLVFYWDRSHCTITGFPTIENRDKPLVLKELRKLWEDHQFHMGKYEHRNTLLLDDSPYKALCNPADTAIFPLSYQYSDVDDCSLGPGGDLRVYLERLAMADSIPEFVRNNHFGQRPIRETNLSWNYYKKVIDSRKSLGKQ